MSEILVRKNEIATTTDQRKNGRRWTKLSKQRTITLQRRKELKAANQVSPKGKGHGTYEDRENGLITIRSEDF